MRWVLVVLATIGVVVASFALREHYRTDSSPCSINDKWDCGIVNHSPYAVFAGIPVAVIGIAGYLLLGALAWMRAYRAMLVPVLVALAFSLYLTRIEARILGVFCIYCVISMGIVGLFTLLTIGTAIRSPASKTN